MNEEDPNLKSAEEPGPVAGLRGLSMESQPQRDLWPGIAARIVVRRQRSRRVWLAAAACTLMAFTAMLSLRLSEVPQSNGEGNGAMRHAPLAAPPEFAAMTLPSNGMGVRSNRAMVKANLRLTQTAEGEVLKAMRQSPDDPSLQNLLDSTREQKRELSEMLLSERN